MIAEVLATGEEIRSGAIVDSNSSYIARTMEEIGVEVIRHTCVGDNMDHLSGLMQEVGTRSDIAIVTGGLGPTTDDLTAASAARAAGIKLILDDSALKAIENIFKSRNRPMSDSNKKQAMLPEGSTCIENPIGTAPGFQLKIGGCHFFFLPGVPHEMRRMLSEEVVPRVRILLGNSRNAFGSTTLSVFGLTESVTGERVSPVEALFPGIKLGLRAKFPVIQIKLYGSDENQNHLDRRLAEASEWVLEEVGDKVFSTDGREMESVVGDLLRKKKATLAVAESCTGGLISHWLTNVPGSSDYLLFSGVTYSNDAKIKILSVSSETISRYGAVHEETAKEMAAGARDRVGATYAISTSGIAGPEGGTDDKPVGTVCIGVATPESTYAFRYALNYGDRFRNKTMFAMVALNLLRRELLGNRKTEQKLFQKNPA